MLELPTLARVKLERLLAMEEESRDAASSIARRASELARARGTAPASELASMDQELTRLQDRLLDLQDRHRNLSNLVAGIRHWVSTSTGTYELVKLTPAMPAGVKTTRSPAQAVSNVRSQIKLLAAERVRVLQSGVPAADLKEQASAYVQTQREHERPKLVFGHTTAFNAQFNALVDGAWSTQQDIGAALAWLDPEKFEKKLHEDIDRLPQPTLAMSSKERAAKLLELEAELLACERAEESLVELSEEQGTPVYRRLDADPRAVLGLALARSKKPKTERIKVA